MNLRFPATVKGGTFEGLPFAALRSLEGQRVTVTVRPHAAKAWRTRRYPKSAPKAKRPKVKGDHRERVKYADGLWSRLVKAKEPSGLCPVCGTRKWSDAMHGWAKGPYPALRHDLDNGAPGCRPCHRRIDSDHHAKEQFWRRYIGDERYERLRLRAQARGKADLALVILDLERRLTPEREGDAA